MEFKRNKETGILEAWKDGKKIGDIKTMGDEVNGKVQSKNRKRKISR